MKRGQSAQVLRYLIAAAIIIAVQFVGFFAYKTISERICFTDLTSFEIAVKDFGDDLFRGTVVEKLIASPCNADEIYFIGDTKYDVSFVAHPFIKYQLEHNLSTNVYVVKNGEVKQSFDGGSFDIPYPGHICFDPALGNINFFAKKDGQQLEITPGCFQSECTQFVQNVSDDNATLMLGEAFSFGATDPTNCELFDCPTNMGSEFSNFVQAQSNIQIWRKYHYCTENDTTLVEITIKPDDGVELGQFRLYEYIPKECVDDLRHYLTSISGTVDIKNDPLIMWSFTSIEEEQTVSYILNTSLPDHCRQIIEAMGIGHVNGGTVVDDRALPPYCGDGVNESHATLSEVCDDGNFLINDGCSSCTVETGWECTGRSAESDCTEICGDGLEVGEEKTVRCDKGTGNANTPNSCRPSCERPRCGDGIIDHNNPYGTNEECDDGGLSLQCSTSCTRTYCGDGVTQSPNGNGQLETCDEGSNNGNNPNRCRVSCVQPTCGDGIVDDNNPYGPNEACDDGAQNGQPLKCDATCGGITATNCGNGIVEAGEVCDDGSDNGQPGKCNVQCDGVTAVVLVDQALPNDAQTTCTASSNQPCKVEFDLDDYIPGFDTAKYFTLRFDYYCDGGTPTTADNRYSLPFNAQSSSTQYDSFYRTGIHTVHPTFSCNYNTNDDLNGNPFTGSVSPPISSNNCETQSYGYEIEYNPNDHEVSITSWSQNFFTSPHGCIQDIHVYFADTLCSNECVSANQRRCVNDPGNSRAEVCANHDTDTCLEWGNPTSCSTFCSALTGQCV